MQPLNLTYAHESTGSLSTIKIKKRNKENRPLKEKKRTADYLKIDRGVIAVLNKQGRLALSDHSNRKIGAHLNNLQIQTLIIALFHATVWL